MEWWKSTARRPVVPTSFGKESKRYWDQTYEARRSHAVDDLISHVVIDGLGVCYSYHVAVILENTSRGQCFC